MKNICSFNISKKYLICFLLFVGSTLNNTAQTLDVHPLPTQQLLPSASVHCIFQDSEGYIWYGTDHAGVSRDDGYQIDAFMPSDIVHSASANHILCIAETPNGDILLGTPNGLFRISKKDYKMYRTGLANVQVNTILKDSKGILWAGTEDGRVVSLDANLNIKHTYPCTLADGRRCPVTRLFEDSNGRLFVLQWKGGLLVKEAKGTQMKRLNWPDKAWPIQIVNAAEKGSFWVATYGSGIVRCTIEGDNCKLVYETATKASQGRSLIFSMLRDNWSGWLWTSSVDDLYAYQVAPDGHLKQVNTDTVLPSGKKIIDMLMLDRKSNIYVAGYTPHTFIISEQTSPIKRMAIDQMLKQTGYPLLPDRSVSDGRYLWIWQGRIGLILYDLQNHNLTSPTWKVGRCITRNVSQKRGLWASDVNHIYNVYQLNGSIKREELVAMPDNQLVCQIHDDGHRMLYVATKRTVYRLHMYDKPRAIAHLASRPIDMAVSPQGDIYLILEDQGLFVIPRTGKPFSPKVSKVMFSAIAIAPDGTLWLAGQTNGVYHYIPSTQKLTRVDSYFQNYNFTSHDIAVDGMGHVWTVTDQRVIEFNPQTSAFRSFDASDPQMNVDFFYGIELEDATQLCINGTGAICKISSSDALNRTVADAIPFVSSYIIDGQTYFVGKGQKSIKIEPGQTELTLNLTTFNHVNTSKISFAYKLDDYHSSWHYGKEGENTIHLGHLPSGNYHLLVRATDENGCWSKDVDVIMVMSLPVWYETWWARLLYFALFLLICFGVWKLERRILILHRLIRRRERVRLDEIELKREDITHDRLDDEFLRKTIDLIEAHISEPGYNVEALTEELCMSRITFYRRLKEQTGQTPTDFIRDVRLKTAARLLIQDNDATIADIASKVGFASPKYFSHLFRDKFGVLPTQYKEKSVEENLT